MWLNTSGCSATSAFFVGVAGERIMFTGTIKKLVHLSQGTHLPGARLVPDHNDKGYGIIEDQNGREVYFRHDVVESRYGFDDLRRGQQVQYTLETATYLRAASVRPVAALPAKVIRERPAA
jgi:cold shock CspA family protein